MSGTTLRKVAVVTGSNKGIGFEIVKSLCQKWDGDVFLCSRNEERGRQALQSIHSQGLKSARLANLAVDDTVSIERLKERLMQEYGGLDILVNNAAIAYLTEDVKSKVDIAKETLHINVTSLANVCDILFPILRPGARIVNLSSSAGMLKRIPGEELRKRIGSNNLTRGDLNDLMQEYIEDVSCGRQIEKGWPHIGYASYIVSKVFVSALTWIQHRDFLKHPSEDIVINAVHPGYVVTDLTGKKGVLTPEEGAVSPVKCCLIPPHGEPRGRMISFDGNVVDWHNDIITGGVSSS
jgi:carbonyl reductase 1